MVRKNRMNGGARTGSVDIFGIDFNEIKQVEIYNHKYIKNQIKKTYNVDGNIITFFKEGIKIDEDPYFYNRKHYEYDKDTNTLRIFVSLLDEIEEKVKQPIEIDSMWSKKQAGGSSQKSKKSLKKKVASVKPIKTDKKYTDKDGVTRTLYTKDGCKYVKMVVYKKI
jgi:hypothetical protein